MQCVAAQRSDRPAYARISVKSTSYQRWGAAAAAASVSAASCERAWPWGCTAMARRPRSSLAANSIVRASDARAAAPRLDLLGLGSRLSRARPRTLGRRRDAEDSHNAAALTNGIRLWSGTGRYTPVPFGGAALRRCCAAAAAALLSTTADSSLAAARGMPYGMAGRSRRSHPSGPCRIN